MGSGIGSIESAIGDLFRLAEHEVLMTAYSIGTGTDLMFQWLDNALSRGVRVMMVVDDFDNQPDAVRNSLRKYARLYSHFVLLGFQGGQDSALHAKTIVVDRKVAIVGSSNMSKRGLIDNFELGVIVHGTTAALAGQAMDTLISSHFVSPVVIGVEALP